MTTVYRTKFFRVCVLVAAGCLLTAGGALASEKAAGWQAAGQEVKEAAGAVGETVTVKREGVRLMKAPRSWGATCGATVAPKARVKIVVDHFGRPDVARGVDQNGVWVGFEQAAKIHNV